ncbi:hypothetical protein C0995_005346 [Termitomyces sp. Mi166|nr:hypothetical protein C0995_005346 [Termitomyces sp. Mi166\
MAGRAYIESLLKLVNSSAQDALAQYEKHGLDLPLLSSTASHPLDITDESLELRKAVRVLEGACEQLCTALAPPIHTIVNRGQNLDWLCLLVVIEAKVADALYGHHEGVHVNELSKSVRIESGKLARILRALATKHVFLEACLTLCHTTLAPQTATIIYDNLSNPKSALSYNPTDSPFMQAVKNEGIDGTFFDWLKAHPEKRATFGRAMQISFIGLKTSDLDFPWSDFSTVCDVGSGVGAFSLPLAKLFPQVKITLFDLPDTIGHAVEHWGQKFPEAQAHNQVEFISGNFFDSIPIANQDIYYLRNIIHNWPDLQARQILGSVRKVMGPNSRLLIHDYVLSHLNQTELEAARVEAAPFPLLPNYGAGSARTYYQDMTMLIMYISKERTLDESVALASTVGLHLEKVWDLAESSLLEFKVVE